MVTTILRGGGTARCVDCTRRTFHISLHQIPMAVHAALMGGNVCVGLEDSVCLRHGELAADSAAQVRRIRGLIEEPSNEVATPDGAQERLKLKGRNKSKAQA